VTKHKNKTLFVFAALIIITFIFIIGKSTFSFMWNYARLEKNLEEIGLGNIAIFESSLKAGLRGLRVWNDRRIYELITQTCRKNPILLQSFSIIYPSSRVYQFTAINITNFYDKNVTNLYNRLKTKKYLSGHLKRKYNGKVDTFYIVKPLKLDNKDVIGPFTFKFYQTIHNRTGDKRHIKEFHAFRKEKGVRSLPLVMIEFSAENIERGKKKFIKSAIKWGIFYLLVICILIIFVAKIQRASVAEEALEQARAENEKLLKKLRYSDRHALLGRTAAALAHEIRNPLSSIRGFIQLFNRNSQDSELRENASLVIKEVDRLNSVITRMLNFSQPIAANFEKSEPNEFIKHSVELIENEARAKNITINYNVRENLPEVLVDKNLMTQAFLNLFINAIDAMPSGGELYIDAELLANKTIKIIVKDTGAGIPEENLKEIFGPYFTTKPSGTGLGLASVENIIYEHSGSIRVESELGKGATFIIELPVYME